MMATRQPVLSAGRRTTDDFDLKISRNDESSPQTPSRLLDSSCLPRRLVMAGLAEQRGAGRGRGAFGGR
jgi:hypothetical protein